MIVECPDVELLAAFLDGRGSDQLADHVEDCSSCAEKIERLLEQERERVFAATTKDRNEEFLNESKYAELRKWTRLLEINPSAKVPANRPDKIGRYQVLRFIGKGSFGDVYAVYDPLFDIERAVKVLRSGLFDSESSRDQFLAEARHAVKVSHPGLVDVRDVEINPDQSFIVMKLIQGENLEKRLRQGPIDIATTVQIMIKVAQAAHHAHEAGLVHRDLKPSNILLDQKQNPVIADFGLVIDQNVQDQSHPTMSRAGTRPYMSPEQYSQYSGNSETIDRRSDIWALGVVLAEMLHGLRPFPQSDRDALSEAIRAEEPVLPPRNQTHELNRMVKRCLAKNPDDRYATAAELANDLSGWSRRHSPNWFVRWQYGWRRNVAIGICLLLLCGVAWAGQSWASRDKIDRMISNLESAPASLIPRRVSDLVATPEAREILKGRSVPLDAAAKFRVNLAMAACGSERIELWNDLADYLQTKSTPLDEIGAALESLRETPRCSRLLDVAVNRLLEKRPDDLRLSPETALRLAAVVAGLRPDDRVWPEISTRIAHDLVRVSEPEFDQWLDLFHPVGANQLSADLTSQMTSSDESREIQLRSARALAAFFNDTVGQPVELVVQADWDELEPLVQVLRSNSALARQVLQGRFETLMQIPRELPVDDNADPTENDVQSARVAVALWQLGDRAAVCQALRHDPEPTLQTLVIFGLAKQPINAEDIVAEVDRVRMENHKNADAIVFGLLQVLCLRNSTGIVQAVSNEWLNQLFQEEKDSGVHSMSRLLAKRLGCRLVQPQSGQHGNWLVEKIGGSNMEFTVIDNPVFQSGILDRKVKAFVNDPWNWHTRSITRRFAIGMREITFDEFRQFCPFFGVREGLNVAGDAAAVGISQQDAFDFCNWCSDQAGLPHCYEWDTACQLVPVPNHLQLPGYRLPTEGEWECACRADTQTGRFFGQSSKAENRFIDYGWVDETPNKVFYDSALVSQPVGDLLPNRWGLFDTYGNVRELCKLSSPVLENAMITVDKTFAKPDGKLDSSGIPTAIRTLVRGPNVTDKGSGYAFSHCRSEQFVDDPSCGIRLARTLVESERD